jgi:hypothetical protein
VNCDTTASKEMRFAGTRRILFPVASTQAIDIARQSPARGSAQDLEEKGNFD